MSRGPGVRQREILRAVDGGRFVWLVDLLPAGYTRAEYQSMYRAAIRLCELGRISIWNFTYGHETVAIGPADAEKPDRPPRRLSAEASADRPPGQRLSAEAEANLPPGQRLR